MRTTIPPDYYEPEPTELERIYEAFETKWTGERFSCNTGGQEWDNYIQEELGLEMIYSEGMFSPLDMLLERIYSGNLDKLVVKDPDGCAGGFILLSREFAQKILVLGELP